MNELLKKEIDNNYFLLSNKEKTLVIIALKSEYKIVEMLKILKIRKSTYFYEKSKVMRDKYKNIRHLIKEIFIDDYECY